MSLWRTFAAAALVLCPVSAWAQDEATIPAQIVAGQFTTLSSEIAAKIDRITVKEGERFKAGQVLISFDCSIHRAQLDETQAVLTAAESSKKAHRRLHELNSTGTLEVERATAEAAVAQTKLNLARTVMSKCAIAAPFNGRVVEQKSRPHQYSQAGQPILDILDDTSLEVEFIVPSHWVMEMKPGQRIEVLVDETRKAYPARVARVGAKVDAVSHSVKVVAEIIGSHPELMAGMAGRVQRSAP